MSKILLINGSPNEHGCTYTALKEIADTLSRNDVESEFLHLGKKPMAGKLAASVVSCRRGGASAAFDRLNKCFGISNMHTVGSQYWNQVHGYTPDDVRKDEEGLQTMRSLAQNMAWLLKNMQAGKEQDIQPPVYEERIDTDFI